MPNFREGPHTCSQRVWLQDSNTASHNPGKNCDIVSAHPGKGRFRVNCLGLTVSVMRFPAHPNVALFFPTLQMAREIHSLSCVMKGRKERGFLTCLSIIQNKEIAQKPGKHLNKLKLPAKSHICYSSFHFILRAIPLQNMAAPVVWCADVPRHMFCTASCLFS